MMHEESYQTDAAYPGTVRAYHRAGYDRDGDAFGGRQSLDYQRQAR